MTGEPDQKEKQPVEAEIDQEIRDKATCCRKDKRCLQEGGQCKVVDSVADKVFFVEGEEGRACSYCLSFGDGRYCNCPVRQELHRKYRR